MGLYEPLRALWTGYTISLWRYPQILPMVFHILVYMVYIFFRYYIYRYTIYRNWKKLDTEAKFLIDNHSQQAIVINKQQLSISNSYHYLSLFPFSSFSFFFHSHIFPFHQCLYTFCNCNSFIPIIIKCYSLFQVSDPVPKSYTFI